LTILFAGQSAAFQNLFLATTFLTAVTIPFTWKRRHPAVLILTATGLEYTGWPHPLPFNQIQNITLSNHRKPDLQFTLKDGGTISLPLTQFACSSEIITATAHRYFIASTETA
jgi:hypothetical protein